MLLHELRLDNAGLALVCTSTTFGSPRDSRWLAGLTIAFYPANPQTTAGLAAAVSK